MEIQIGNPVENFAKPYKRTTKIVNFMKIKDKLSDNISKAKPVKFTDVALKTLRVMRDTEFSEVSMQTSFVCLLHLANEHGKEKIFIILYRSIIN